jgi:hypothetical protein
MEKGIESILVQPMKPIEPIEPFFLLRAPAFGLK